MKLLFASDIHGSALYCEKLLNNIKKEMPEKIIILGDVLYHGPRNDLPEGYAPKEVIKMLNPLSDKIIAVRGNCDAEVDNMVLDFDVSETYKRIFADGKHIFLTHGHIYNRLNPFDCTEKYVMFNGHFHVPEIRDEGSFYYVNDGSVSIPKMDSARSYAVWTDGLIELKRLDDMKPFKKMKVC